MFPCGTSGPAQYSQKPRHDRSYQILDFADVTPLHHGVFLAGIVQEALEQGIESSQVRMNEVASQLVCFLVI